MKVDIRSHPFCLGEDAAQWVEKTLAGMTLEQKIGQMFFSEGVMANRAKLKKAIEKVGVGGIMYRSAPSKVITADHRALQALSRIPLFLAANVEAGGNGLITDGTMYGSAMLVAASGKPENARNLGEIAAREASSVGGNMAFAPIIDINFNWRNPITNTRSFGDNPETVAAMGAAYVKGAMANGCAVTIKHFPGDGCDGRDQHIATTINSLSYEDWMASYGKAYKASIDAGATALMVGHISQPACADRLGRKDIRDLPATLSPVLLGKLLREELGYKGLTMTDASAMTGFVDQMPRREAVPATIAAGCDMLLFQKNIDEDFGFIMEAVRAGRITTERIDEAVTRILAVKANLGLHNRKPEELVPGTFNPEMKARHQALTRELADEGITLVRDDQKLLPLDPTKRKKIAFIPLGGEVDGMELMKKVPGLKGTLIRTIMRISAMINPPPPKTFKALPERLRKEGFEVDEIDYNDLFAALKVVGKSVNEFREAYDLVIYASVVAPLSNSTNLLLRYTLPGGMDAPWMVQEVPTLFISFGSPYHGYEVPMIPTFINAYNCGVPIVDALIEKLRGRSPFKGKSPVRLDFAEFIGKLPPR